MEVDSAVWGFLMLDGIWNNPEILCPELLCVELFCWACNVYIDYLLVRTIEMAWFANDVCGFWILWFWINFLLSFSDFTKNLFSDVLWLISETFLVRILSGDLGGSVNYLYSPCCCSSDAKVRRIGPVNVDGRLIAGEGFAPTGVDAQFMAEWPLGIDDLCMLAPVNAVGNYCIMLEVPLIAAKLFYELFDAF